MEHPFPSPEPLLCASPWVQRSTLIASFHLHSGTRRRVSPFTDEESKDWSNEDDKLRSGKAGISLQISDRQDEAGGMSVILTYSVQMRRLGIREA